MEPTVQAKINIISTNHANPNWAAGQMLEVIKENVKLVNRTTQTWLLSELVKKKIPLNEKTRKHTEAEFNSIGKAMLHFLRVGAGRKHDDRIKEAMLTENVMLPSLSHYTAKIISLISMLRWVRSGDRLLVPAKAQIQEYLI